jgi:hypothetical protein
MPQDIFSFKFDLSFVRNSNGVRPGSVLFRALDQVFFLRESDGCGKGYYKYRAHVVGDRSPNRGKQASGTG